MGNTTSAATLSELEAAWVERRQSACESSFITDEEKERRISEGIVVTADVIKMLGVVQTDLVRTVAQKNAVKAMNEEKQRRVQEDALFEVVEELRRVSGARQANSSMHNERARRLTEDCRISPVVDRALSSVHTDLIRFSYVRIAKSMKDSVLFRLCVEETKFKTLELLLRRAAKLQVRRILREENQVRTAHDMKVANVMQINRVASVQIVIEAQEREQQRRLTTSVFNLRMTHIHLANLHRDLLQTFHNTMPYLCYKRKQETQVELSSLANLSKKSIHTLENFLSGKPSNTDIGTFKTQEFFDDVTNAVAARQHIMEAQQQIIAAKRRLHKQLTKEATSKALSALCLNEQCERVARKSLQNILNDDLVRAVAARKADEAADVEQQQRVAQSNFDAILNEHLVREFAQKQADADADLERAQRVARKSMENILNNDLVRAIAAKQADEAADVEQQQRVTRKSMENILNNDLVRVIAAKQADEAADVEQQQRVTRKSMENILNNNLVRVIAAKQADEAADVEQQQRIAHHNLNDILNNDLVRAVAAKQADEAADVEQQQRVTRKSMENILNNDLVRVITAKQADEAADVEQQQRVTRKSMENILNNDLVRVIAAKQADEAADVEQQQRIAHHNLNDILNNDLVRKVQGKKVNRLADVEQAQRVSRDNMNSVLEQMIRKRNQNKARSATKREVDRRLSRPINIPEHILAIQSEIRTSVIRSVGIKYAKKVTLQEQSRRSFDDLLSKVHEQMDRRFAQQHANNLADAEQLRRIANPMLILPQSKDDLNSAILHHHQSQQAAKNLAKVVVRRVLVTSTVYV